LQGSSSRPGWSTSQTNLVQKEGVDNSHSTEFRYDHFVLGGSSLSGTVCRFIQMLTRKGVEYFLAPERERPSKGSLASQAHSPRNVFQSCKTTAWPWRMMVV
jgi:hypothetical protein